MPRTTQQLQQDACTIWQAGVTAVDSQRLVSQWIHVEGDRLAVGEESLPLDRVRRLVVVGAGKAGAGMAEGFETAVGTDLLAGKQAEGWVNVPEDCLRELQFIHLHPARPAGVNEPTERGVATGTQHILELVESLTPDDLCICLLSGGGSALLPAPVDGISLADKQAVTKHLSGAGANIQQLNTVRKQLSRIKGGGLARACRAGTLITLIISDVLGDPLDVIASGPTVEDSSTPREALDVLETFAAREAGIAPRIFTYLEEASRRTATVNAEPARRVINRIIGNNAVAVDAAGMEAERRGYAHAMVAASDLEGQAEEVGRHLAAMAVRMRDEEGPDCLITGGEPVVQLVAAEKRGLGGRNQQLVLAALEALMAADPPVSPKGTRTNPLQGIALLSGGTDGEDGPTDAAGAWIDAEVVQRMLDRGLAPADFLQRNDAYRFFEPLEALIRTGPTHTNVCDLRVLVVSGDDR